MALYRKNPVMRVSRNPTAVAALERAMVLMAETENIFSVSSSA